MINDPILLTDDHNVDNFNSGVDTLDNWLIDRALKNQKENASRTYVVSENKNVIAYYSLATGSIMSEEAISKFKRNMPNPIPVIILARLAVDKNYQGKGFGRYLVKDASIRVAQAADLVGVRGLIVHAISEDAKEFYKSVGFNDSPLNPMTLMITLKDLKATFNITD
ncbi:Acetyltransferase (GNAT) family protein [Photorhabdus australis subsp. thailandensis]|uniref:Acetyltransferase (GNAT) family protein n=1 Tax=Photorhabdus australis subsp. thailandensis TaxID=2805096 RepID=A0A1C0U830_9GAMM|nr:GNAT family N-acetyltransferase [Photorhabdus australis]OCQ54100.1 Acetyltransferase (GNAT) family protein [Photorhabdus australis subsp. thailandensis]